MPRIEPDELEILEAYEKGQLKFVATKAELAKFKAAARATAIKDMSPVGLLNVPKVALNNRAASQRSAVLHRVAEAPPPNTQRTPGKRGASPRAWQRPELHI